MLHDPDLLILDEPFTGLDPEGRKKIADIVLEEKAEGKTIFFSSHILSDIERLCDEVIMIRKGQTVLTGRLEEIRAMQDTWQIRVEGWTQFPEHNLDSAWELDITQKDTLTEIICTENVKDQLLSRLLELPAQVVDVQQKTQSLEELYMTIEQNQSTRA